MKKIIADTISKKELPYDIQKVVFVEADCKTCGKEKRRNGSAYCQKCSDNYKLSIKPKKKRNGNKSQQS